MSVISPRSHALAHNEYYKDQVEAYMWRNKVKPGITGWAQVNGFRGETDTVDKMAKRIEYDLWYMENWSLILDIKIFLKTFIGGFTDKNAY
ncbi:MAG: putative colanic acid biosynthesis UDP-glucose lipid carrier transferase [Pseudomonadales bacterium]|jgi:putative colanic acid biosynthesis UDP-glucose lipid carrier transferase